jgi:hypothetical protein
MRIADGKASFVLTQFGWSAGLGSIPVPVLLVHCTKPMNLPHTHSTALILYMFVA